MTDVLESRDLDTAESRFRAAKAASTGLATVTTVQKNRGLEAIADALLARSAEIIAANAEDLAAARAGGLAEGLIDRLTLDDHHRRPP